MHASDVLAYGHATLLRSAEMLPQDLWLDAGVCGTWSTRDLLAHLSSYELVLGDILAAFSGDEQEGYLDEFFTLGSDFNDTHVALRQTQTAAQALEEYKTAYEHVADRARSIDAERWSQPGTIPWYGCEYSLDDLLVYQYYGHKREHAAQIDAFRDRLGPGRVSI